MTTAQKPRTAPGPGGSGILGDLPDFRRDPLSFFMKNMRQYGDFVRFRGGNRITYLAAHPDYVRHVLQENPRNYRKGWSFRKIKSIFDVPLIIPTSENREFRKAVRTLDDIVYRVIKQQRQEDVEQSNNLLSLLMHARDEETGESMSDEQLRDEVMTLLLAGHET